MFPKPEAWSLFRFTGCIALQRALNQFTVLNIAKNLELFSAYTKNHYSLTIKK